MSALTHAVNGSNVRLPSSAFGTAKVQRSRANLLLSVITLLLAVVIAIMLFRNPNFEWGVVLEYLTYANVLKGIGTTLWLTLVVVVIGLIGGVLIALLRQSKIVVVARLAWMFTWFFRSVPMLVQLIFWYNLAALFPRITIGIPGLEPFFSVHTNDVITPFVAVIVGFSLHEAAYMSEIVRSGLAAVPRGQWMAGRSIGLTETALFRKIIFPQVMRVVVPTLGNETISVMKMTSLVSVIAVTDLLYSVQLIYGINFKTIPLLVVATIWYLVITIGLGLMQSLLERYYGKSLVRAKEVRN